MPSTPTTIHVILDGNVQGPFSHNQAMEMVRRGQLLPETLAWKEGLADWKRLDQLIVWPTALVAKPQPAATVSASSQPQRPPSEKSSQSIFAPMAGAHQTFKSGNGHPVADNALRMLFGGCSDGSTLKDLERNAKVLRLQAKHGPITPTEPLDALCPRQRSVEDYGLAIKQVSDPTHLAVALFFWPSSFGVENPMQQANCWLLEAEGLPQGDSRKAELLVHAIREYDSAKTDSWAGHAVLTARQMLEAEPDVQQVRREVGEAVRKVAEKAIVDFGDTIEPSEIDLLNAIDECVRLPEIRGASRAAEAVIQKQLQRIDGYLENAYRVLRTSGTWKTAGLSRAEIQSLVTGCQQARDAFALLQRRPALLRSMPSDRIVHLSTVSVALAFPLGTKLALWEDALRLSSGIDPKNIDPSHGREAQLFLQIACRALPLLHRASQKHDVEAALDHLRHEFPDGWQVIEVFKQGAAALQGRTNAVPASSNGGTSVTTASEMIRGRTQLHAPEDDPEIVKAKRGAVVALFIFIGVVTLYSCASVNKGVSSTPTPAAVGSYRVPRSAAPGLRQEKDAIEASRRAVKAQFSQAERLQREIDSSAAFLDRANSLAVAEHNRKVSEYNSLVAQARGAQSTLSARVDAYNTRLRQDAR